MLSDADVKPMTPPHRRDLVKCLPIRADPASAIAKLKELFAGWAIVNIHAGQPDRKRVVYFYASYVLPAFKRPA